MTKFAMVPEQRCLEFREEGKKYCLSIRREDRMDRDDTASVMRDAVVREEVREEDMVGGGTNEKQIWVTPSTAAGGETGCGEVEYH
jgi:hypothetical protein